MKHSDNFFGRDCRNFTTGYDTDRSKYLGGAGRGGSPYVHRVCVVFAGFLRKGLDFAYGVQCGYGRGKSSVGRAAAKYEKNMGIHRAGGAHYGIRVGIFYGNVFCGNGRGCSANRFHRVAGVHRDDVIYQYLVHGEIQEAVGYRHLLPTGFNACDERDFRFVVTKKPHEEEGERGWMEMGKGVLVYKKCYFYSGICSDTDTLSLDITLSHPRISSIH